MAIRYSIELPKEERDKLLETYKKSDKKIEGFEAGCFLDSILAEMDCEAGRARRDDPEPGPEKWWLHSGNAWFMRWVTTETHYALCRQGFEFDEQRGFIDVKKLLKQEETFDDYYCTTKMSVLEAVVARSIDFFKERNEVIWRGEKYNKQLSCALKDYLK